MSEVKLNKRLKGYVFEPLRDIKEVVEIIRVLSAGLEEIDEKRKEVLNNFFIPSLDEYGCSRYEAMLGITPGADDTLDDRRYKIQTIFKGDTPYTITALKQKLADLCGEKNITVSLDAENYALTVKLGLASKNQYNAAYELIQRMIPCNLTLDYSLKYNKHKTVGELTHAGLHSFTHEQIRYDYLGVDEN